MSKQPSSNKSRSKEEFLDKFEAWKNHEITKSLFALITKDKHRSKERILDEALRNPESRPTNFDLIKTESTFIRVVERIESLSANDLLSVAEEVD